MPREIDAEKHWIVQVSRNNDEKAFRQLFEHYYAPLVQYSTYITGSVSLAEEIVSEVFVNMWKNRSKLSEVQDFKKYVYTSTKHKTIDYIRHAKDLSFVSIDKKDFEECIVYNNPEDQFVESEIRSRIEAVILKLPERCRIIYRFVKEDHMKYREVADLLDISPKTVENQMAIAMKKIREEIASHYLSKHGDKRFSFFSNLFL